MSHCTDPNCMCTRRVPSGRVIFLGGAVVLGAFAWALYAAYPAGAAPITDCGWTTEVQWEGDIPTRATASLNDGPTALAIVLSDAEGTVWASETHEPDVDITPPAYAVESVTFSPLAREDGCRVTHRPTPAYAPPAVPPGDHRPDVDDPSEAVSRLLGTR